MFDNNEIFYCKKIPVYQKRGFREMQYQPWPWPVAHVTDRYSLKHKLFNSSQSF